MKLFLVFAITLISTGAFACPDLSGIFDCGFKGILEIKMHDTGYEFIEDNDPSFVPTDNVSHQLDETTSFKGFCKEESFHIRINSLNESVGPLVVETAFFLDANSDLNILGGLRYDVDGKEKAFPYGSVCTRKK